MNSKKKIGKKTIIYIAIPVCFIICFSLLLHGVSQEKLKEKFIDVQNYLGLLDSCSAAYGNGGDRFDTIMSGIHYIDSLPHIFAALYDSNLELLLDRHPEEGTSPFDPRKDGRFREMASDNETGTILIEWEDLDGGITKRTMHTCFRWVSVPGIGEGPYLMAAGVSSYSLVSPTVGIFIGAIMGTLTVSIFSMLGFAVFIVLDIIHLRYRRTKK